MSVSIYSKSISLIRRMPPAITRPLGDAILRAADVIQEARSWTVNAVYRSDVHANVRGFALNFHPGYRCAACGTWGAYWGGRFMKHYCPGPAKS
jgi:hypothetical protein